MSGDLIDRLNAALDERERLTRAATPGPWHALDGGVVDDDHEQWPVSGTETKRNREDRVFIAANDPAHVLREVAGVRRIVARCAETLAAASPCFTVESCDEVDAILAERVLEDLVAIYLPEGETINARPEEAP